MKQVVFILLLLIFAKPVIAQNEDLIREVENYILKVDSLIMCRQDTTVTGVHWNFHPRPPHIYHTVEISTYGFGDLRAMECEEFDKATILNHTISYYRSRTLNRHQREYFKNGNLVAVINSWERIIPSQESTRRDIVGRMVVYVSGNEIIFFQREGRVRNWRRVKAEIRERYNLR